MVHVTELGHSQARLFDYQSNLWFNRKKTTVVEKWGGPEFKSSL